MKDAAMLLKNVSVDGQQFLLRSRDGKAWFCSPRDLLEYQRRRARQRVELRERFIYAVDLGWNRKRNGTEASTTPLTQSNGHPGNGK